jgi:hypothetical protein
MALTALGVVANATSHNQTWHPYMALTLLAVGLVTSRMKVKLPGITGNMSVNLPFLLLSVVTLSATEAILITCASTIAQTLPRERAKFRPVHLLFNISMMAVSSGAAALLFHAPAFARVNWVSFQLLIAATSAVFFLGQTVPVSIIIALTDGGTLRRTWTSVAQLSFPYFVASAGVTSMVSSGGHPAGWLAAMSLLPVMYGIYRSYVLYFMKAVQNISQPLATAVAAGTRS